VHKRSCHRVRMKDELYPIFCLTTPLFNVKRIECLRGDKTPSGICYKYRLVLFKQKPLEFISHQDRFVLPLIYLWGSVLMISRGKLPRTIEEWTLRYNNEADLRGIIMPSIISLVHLLLTWHTIATDCSILPFPLTVHLIRSTLSTLSPHQLHCKSEIIY
jgi:hypothetical protein